MTKMLIIIAGLLGATGVGLSAYVAHGVTDAHVYKSLNSVATFSLFNALAILAILAVAQAYTLPRLTWSASGIAIGGILFKLGVILSLTNLPFRIPIAPIGGMTMIFSWLSVIVFSLRL